MCINTYIFYVCINCICTMCFGTFFITWIQCDYPKIAVAFDFLLKYITNLLSERLPQNWWSINTKLPQFVHRISNVKGAKEVLKTAGYCIEQHGTLSFPEDKRKVPDRELLSVVSAELLIAKAECERAKQGCDMDWLRIRKFTTNTATSPILDIKLGPQIITATPTHISNKLQEL